MPQRVLVAYCPRRMPCGRDIISPLMAARAASSTVASTQARQLARRLALALTHGPSPRSWLRRRSWPLAACLRRRFLIVTVCSSLLAVSSSRFHLSFVCYRLRPACDDERAPSAARIAASLAAACGLFVCRQIRSCRSFRCSFANSHVSMLALRWRHTPQCRRKPRL